jgi:hypothetical protein
MAAYNHLVNLDFVRAANRGETNFGRIPQADVTYPRKQLFDRLEDEYFKAGRLHGSSSDLHFTLFNMPVVGEGLEAHAKSLATWFLSVKSMNFRTDNDQLDWLEANTQVNFIHKASQSQDVTRSLRQIYIRLFQRICVEQAANPNPITMRRLNVMIAVFRSDCATGHISTTSDAPLPLPVRALHADDESTNIDQLVVKDLDKMHARLPADNRDGRVRQRNIRNVDLSCFWCGAKGHTLLECPHPPTNSKAKDARDQVVTNRENKTSRAQRREVRRLAQPASSTCSIFTTDDEDTDELDDC